MRRRRKRNGVGVLAGKSVPVLHSTWAGLCAAFGHACVYCGGPGPLTRDHVWPRVRGGGGIESGNIVPACERCNLEKGQMTAYEYFLWLRTQGRNPRFRMPDRLWRRVDQRPDLHQLERRL